MTTTRYLVSNNAELMSALSVSLGGETIELVAGDYGKLNIRDFLFSSDVTIVSEDPLNPAIVHDLYVGTSSHLIFDGILFDYVAPANPANTSRPFEVNDSSYITIRNSVFDGDEVPSDIASGVYGTGFGMVLNVVDNIVIENNEFRKFWKALVAGSATDIVVRGNDVHSIRADGFNFIAVIGLLVEGNYIHDLKAVPGGSDHLDMIQFWQVSLNQQVTRDVIIRGNFLDGGVGSRAQSLFIRNEVVDNGLGSFEDYAYKNILIENNVIYNQHVHGITVGQTDGLVIRNNTLLYDANVADELTEGNNAPRLNPSVASLNVVVENNISESTFNWDVQTNQPGWTVGNNLFVQRDDPNGENYYGDLFVNPFATPASLADLRAVAGGVIEVGATGAAMTRADIQMVVGPYATAPDPVPEPGVCEALLAEALAVEAELEAQLATITVERDTARGERDAALALQAIAETELLAALAALGVAATALTDMTAERDAALAALAVANTALISMTAERDAALQSESAALDDLETAQTQLAVEVAKLAAIRVILEG